MVGFKYLPPELWPRERLLDQGPDVLEDEELLSLILGTGRGSGEDALMLAGRVLTSVGGLRGLASMDPEALMDISGIGPAKAARLSALFELCQRVQSGDPVTPAPTPPDPMLRCVQRMRGQIPTGETAILCYCPEPGRAPVTLALGEGLGPQTRPGALLARLLQAPASEVWWVVIIRPNGRPREDERAVAARLVEGAALVGLPLERVVLISGPDHWTLR